MGKYWGGSQFILIPHDGEKVHPALLRAAVAYDPDHIFEYNFTQDEMARCAGEAIEPEDPDPIGKIYQAQARHILRPPTSLLEATSIYRMDVLDDRPPSGNVSMTADTLGKIMPLTDMPGGHDHGVYQAVPKQCGGSLGLAMAMRCGFIEPPTLPFVMQAGFDLDYEDVRFSLNGEHPTRLMLTSTGGLAVSNPIPEDVLPSWRRTEPGLGAISFVPPILRPSITVVGSTVEDFCLAYALDRMTQFSLWLPDELLTNGNDNQAVEYSLFTFLNDADTRGSEKVITSISWSEEKLQGLVDDRFQRNQIVIGEEVRVDYVPASDIPIGRATILAGMPSDYGINFTFTTSEDDLGGVDITQGIPAIEPQFNHYAPKERPFWEVDVTVNGTTTPAGRNSPHLKVDTNPSYFGMTVARSSQAGISFHAQSQGLIQSGQPTRHIIARPKLRFPNLLEWVQSRCSATATYSAALPSDAGRRAMIASDLVGGRAELAADFKEHGPLFREFLRPAPKSGNDYPGDDGWYIRDLEAGVLSFRGAMRVLNRPEKEVRSLLDTFVGQSILRRGFALRCNACRRLSFFAVGSVSQNNQCPRCNSISPLVRDAWIGTASEPEWFYDLHSAIGTLIGCNADVPLMAGAYLRSQSRYPFADIPELNFVNNNDSKEDEIDIVAHCDNQVIVGEAKCMDHIGSTPKERKSAAYKFVRVAQFLHADQIVLASSTRVPWRDTSINDLSDIINRAAWSYGPPPKIRLITGIGTGTVSDLNVLGQPWKSSRL